MMKRMRGQTHHVITGNMFLLNDWGLQALKDLLRQNTTVLQSLELTMDPTVPFRTFNGILWRIQCRVPRTLIINELAYLPSYLGLHLTNPPWELVELRLHKTTCTSYNFLRARVMPQLRTLVVGTKGRDSRLISRFFLVRHSSTVEFIYQSWYVTDKI